MTQIQRAWKILKSESGYDIVNGERHVAGHRYGNTREAPSETADMNLIAAAPDMLEACEWAYKVLSENLNRKQDAISVLQTAIKKAKGEL